MLARTLLALGLMIALLAVPLGVSRAQSSPDTPSSTPPGTPLPPSAIPSEPSRDEPPPARAGEPAGAPSRPAKAGLRAVAGPSCHRPGDLIVVEGRGLDGARGYSLLLELPAAPMTLQVTGWLGSRLIARLADDPRLLGGRRYRLVLIDRRGQAVGDSPGVFLELCQAAARTEVPPSGQPARGAVPGEVTLLLDNGAADPQGAATALGYAIEERVLLAALGREILRLSVPSDRTLTEAVDELRAALPGAIVDVNSLYGLQAGPRLYAKRAIGWPENSFLCANGGRDSRIGLIDGNLDLTHPALAGRSPLPRSFLKSGEKPVPQDHATAIAALLVGKASGGAAEGLLPGAQLYVAEVFHEGPDGKIRTSTLTVVVALNWLAEEKLRVVNLSFAGARNAVLSASLAEAHRQGMIVIAASGNNGPDAPPAYPAADRSVIAVTAVDAQNRLYAKANRGGYIDFAAPGVDVWTARAGGGGAYRSGTSFAAPYVAAVAAAELALNSRLSAGLLKEGMRHGALDLGPAGKDPGFGWGLARAPKACAG